MIQLHTRVQVLPGNDYQPDGKDYYKEYDEGTVSKMEGFDSENDEFQITWDRTGKTIGCPHEVWIEWFKIVGKAVWTYLKEDIQSALRYPAAH